MPRNEKPKVKSRKAKPSVMFYGRLKIRILADTLRAFAAGTIVGVNEEAPGTQTSIADVPELDVLFREVFVSPDTFVNMNPLDREGREYWTDLLTAYEGRKFGKAREMASAFTDWLDGEYQKRERLQFDHSTFSVLLDGDLYERLRPEGYAILILLARTPGFFFKSEGLIKGFQDLAVTESPVFQPLAEFPDGAAGLKRITRAIQYLPPELRRVISGVQGLGRRLSLPPL